VSSTASRLAARERLGVSNVAVMAHSLADLLSRLDRWPRRLAALTCLLLAAASAVAAHRSPAREQGQVASARAVVVAARDLAVGSTLTAHDLTTVAWPRELVPAGASGEPGRLVGRRLAGPLRKREAVTATRLLGAALTAGLAPGEVATAVLTDAGVASFVHPGDHVDILAGPPDGVVLDTLPGKSGAVTAGAILVAEAVAVLAVLPPTQAMSGAGDAQVLVVTDRGTALRIVALQGRQVVAVVGTSS
jgi:pilus assembly protein CpaB